VYDFLLYLDVSIGLGIQKSDFYACLAIGGLLSGDAAQTMHHKFINALVPQLLLLHGENFFGTS